MKWSATYSIEKQPWRGLLLNFVYYDFVHGVNSLWPQVRSLDQSKKHIFLYVRNDFDTKSDSVHPVITGMGVSVSVKISKFFSPIKIQATCKCMERVIVEAKHASLT